MITCGCEHEAGLSQGLRDSKVQTAQLDVQTRQRQTSATSSSKVWQNVSYKIIALVTPLVSADCTLIESR